MKKILPFTLLFVLLINCKDKPQEPLNFVQLEIDDKTPFDCKDDDCTSIELSIPFATNEKHPVAEKINNHILNEVDDIVEVDDITATSQSYEELTKNYIANFNKFINKYPDETLAWKARVNGNITFFNEDLLSIDIMYYTFAGGAYGFESEKSLNFNPKTGDLYSITDLINNWTELQKLFSFQLKGKMDVWKNANELNYPESIFFYEDTVGFLYNALDEDMVFNGPIKIELPKEKVIPFLNITLAPADSAN